MAIEERPYRLSQLLPGAGDVAARNPALLPGLLATGTLLVLAASEGGFYATAWYPAALFLLALLAVTAAVVGVPRRVPAPILVALALLAGYAAWSYLSILWAQQQAEAWDGANRASLYVVVFALVALWPFDARGGRLLLGLYGAGIASIGLVELLSANAAADPLSHFIDARLSEPTGYQNANAALFTIGLLCCLWMAVDRGVPALLRGPFLGGAGLLAALALMGQSRGWFIALPLALIVMVLIVPGRPRLLGAMLVCGLGLAAVASPVLAVHDDFSPERLDALLSDATGAILPMSAALAVLWLIVALADRRLEPAAPVRRVAGVGVAVVAALALLAGAVAFAVELGSPVSQASDAWDDFKSGRAESTAGSSRLTSLGTNRYDFWSVAWEMFEERPLDGHGSGNFQQAYLARGDSGEQPRYPHSLELGVLSQTGLVGAALLGGALLAGLAGALRARRTPPETAAVAMAATSVWLYWFLHASVDWFWEFPALTGAALAALGLACSMAPRGDPLSGRASRARRALWVPAAVAALALAASLAAPWLSARHTSRAANDWPEDPEAALERLERAADLNPLSARPALVAATIELRRGRDPAAARHFREALERDPESVYPHLLLGAIAAERGREAQARRLLRRAAALSPNDGVVEDTLEDVRAGRRVMTEEVGRRLAAQARSRVD
jgi:O-Antigen ligase